MKFNASKIGAMALAGSLFLFFLVNLVSLPPSTAAVGSLSVFPQAAGFISNLNVSDFILLFAMASFMFDIGIYLREKR